MSSSSRRPRVIVCGTGFGRIYLAAFRDQAFPFELAGILARGSERSRTCAQAYGVPLFTDPDALPADIDMACVVVSASVNGGRGAELAQALMRRGIHVLQEHPLHERELAECLREARRQHVAYLLNTHYVHIEPIRAFITAARALRDRQPLLFLDGACGVQTAFTFFDILGEVLGGLRPWAFAGPLPWTDTLQALSDDASPFACLHGIVAGVPITLRIQNTMDPGDPDNYVHFLHRIAVGTASGTLTLTATHGPIVWCARAHMPDGVRSTATLAESDVPHYDQPSATVMGPATAPTYREILESIWPAGVRRAVGQLHALIDDTEAWWRRSQYHLSVSAAWHDAMTQLGQVRLIRGDRSGEIAPRVEVVEHQ